MSLRCYFLNIRDEESAAAFLREKGVFRQDRSCPSCHHDMEFCSRGPTVCPQWDYHRDGRVIESMWSQAKRAHRQRCSTHRSALLLHLCELMWRRRLRPGEDEIDRIVQDIATLHPLV
ncbi:hypothetical protein M514_08843 [Trichuris suis]|uniref:Uncharacterized protein n=1 Tax=Trichuris suis TaxID=68888 RepID=A0A085MPZ2_9BILA|nr:hypothetical protein M513_08843 [Trichuris suis]KFD59288.1 hypothetical protein M514_08843 [Trichuris suis]